MNDPTAEEASGPGIVRFPWPPDFPDVVIHSPESAVKKHAEYTAAKAGDVTAADMLIRDTLAENAVGQLRHLGAGVSPVLISIHAKERTGINTIPQMMAEILHEKLGWAVEQDVVQENVVNHTGLTAFPDWPGRPGLSERWSRGCTSLSTISSGRVAPLPIFAAIFSIMAQQCFVLLY